MEITDEVKKTFRNYDQGDITAAVREHYRKMRSRQTVGYVQRMKKKYLTYDKPLNLWEAMAKLNVGCQLPDTCVYPEFNALNPDMQDSRFNTETGKYAPNCGIDQLDLAGDMMNICIRYSVITQKIQFPKPGW